MGLGYVQLDDATVGDVILKDDLALLGGSKQVTLVSLTDKTRPKVLGTAPGVGGRLAIGENGAILFSTERSVFGGTDLPLGGVRTAALGNLAIIEGTDPLRIVVGEGPRAAEAFKLKLRVIPPDYEIGSSVVQYRVWNATIGAPVNVTLTNGRGELPLPFGFTFPEHPTTHEVARPRLVINEGTPEELASGPRAWSLEQPEVQLVWGDKDVEPMMGIEPKNEVVTSDLPEIGVEVTSPEWFRRFSARAAGAPRDPRTVTWSSASPPAATRAGQTISEDGIFETTLDTGTAVGPLREVQARVGEVFLGATEPLEVEPGEANEARSTLVLEKEALPADDKSLMAVTLTAKDRAGNPVADGTVVKWEVGEDTDGEFVEAQEATQGGVATVKYRVGIDPGEKTLRAYVDDVVLEKQVEQVPLGVMLIAPTIRSYHDRTAQELRVRLVSSAGPVSEEAEIGWFATVGLVEQTRGLVDGEAIARWKYETVTHRPRVDFAVVVGKGRAQQRMVWIRTRATASIRPVRPDREAPGGGLLLQEPVDRTPVASVEPMAIAGDLAQDGSVPYELPDGTFEQVPVKATASYKLTGLVPGERVSVRLGSSRNPNVLPVLHFSGDVLVDGVVPDLTGGHDGQATTGVSLTTSGYRGGALAFDGTGVVTVEPNPELFLPGAFMVQAAVKPPPGAAATLFEKPGEYRLELVEEGAELRARITLTTSAGDEAMTSLVPVPSGAWSLVSARYQDGRLWIGVQTNAGKAEDFMVVAGVPAKTTQQIEIGSGFAGELDEIRLFDLTRSPLMYFEGGLQSLSLVADGFGEAQATIVSSGQTRPGTRAAAYIASLAPMAPQAPDEGEPTLTGQSYGFYFTDAETFWEDYGEQETTPIGIVTSATLAFMARFGRGVFVGADTGEIDGAVLAGDLAGTFFLAPVALVRDLSNATDRAIQGQETGDDALALALGLVQVAGTLTNGKLGAVLKASKLIKDLPKGSRAAKAVARLIALETKLAAGAAGVSRVRKLIEVAQLSAGASQLVGLGLDICGVHVPAIEAFNGIMTNAVEAEVPGVLAELQKGIDQFDAEDVRTAMQALATPYDDGSAGSAAASSAFRFVRPTAQVMRGMWAAQAGLKAAGASKVTPRARVFFIALLTRRDRLDPEPIYGGFDVMIQKMGADGFPAVAAMARRLGSWRPNVRLGQRFVLQVLLEKVGPKPGVLVEKYVSLTVRGVKKPLKRFYDLVDGNLHYEIKNWGWKGFPPSLTDSLKWRALLAARNQWIRDVAYHALTAGGEGVPGRLRFVFPSALKPFETSLKAYFKSALGGPTLKKYMVDNPADPDQLRLYQQTIDEVLRRINEIIVFHP